MHEWRHKIYRTLFGGPVRIGVAATVIGGLILLVIGAIWVSGDNSRAPGGGTSLEAEPDNREQEVETRSFWLEPPRMFDPVPEVLSATIDGYLHRVVALDAFGGDVQAASPGELVDNPAIYEGKPIFVVGRVVDTRVRESMFALEREITIVGSNPTAAAVIGAADDLGSCCPNRGDVVYALVQLAAVGDAPAGPPGAPVRRVAYVVTDAQDAQIETVIFPINPEIVGSHAIRSLALEARSD